MPEKIPTEERIGQDGSPTEALRSVLMQLGELREYATYFVSTKVDGIRASIRQIGTYAVLGIVVAIAGATLVVSAVALFCWGIAGAIAAGTGSWWLGSLITGAGLLILMGLILGIALQRMARKALNRTREKYEQQQRRQRQEFGHDVHERATSGQ